MIFQNLPDIVEIHRAAKATDEYGNPSADFGINATVNIMKGWLQREQDTGGESINAERSISSANFRLYLPAGADIRVRDRVKIEGETYTVEGEPTKARGLRGASHVKVRLRRLQG